MIFKREQNVHTPQLLPPPPPILAREYMFLFAQANGEAQ